MKGDNKYGRYEPKYDFKMITSSTVTVEELGNKINYPITPGKIYYTKDGYIVFDHYVGTDNVPTRTIVNAADADTINGFTVEKSVPSDAQFTDTTYSVVTHTNDGLMSTSDKIKLDKVINSLDNNGLGYYTEVTDNWNKVFTGYTATEFTDTITIEDEDMILPSSTYQKYQEVKLIDTTLPCIETTTVEGISLTTELVEHDNLYYGKLMYEGMPVLFSTVLYTWDKESDIVDLYIDQTYFDMDDEILKVSVSNLEGEKHIVPSAINEDFLPKEISALKSAVENEGIGYIEIGGLPKREFIITEDTPFLEEDGIYEVSDFVFEADRIYTGTYTYSQDGIVYNCPVTGVTLSGTDIVLFYAIIEESETLIA